MRNILLFSLVILTHFSFSQGTLNFENETHDFGQIDEFGGFAETTFNFVNGGNQPIKITNVRASCGCTTPDWSKEEVMPGESGYIKARYNPRNRPGKFRKSLKVSTTGEQKTLFIAGFVKPRPRDVLEEYTISSGDLRLKHRSLNFGKITPEKPIEKSFDVYNAGNDSLSLLKNLMEIPAHLKINLEPEHLAAREKGVLKIVFDPEKKDDLGFLSDNFTIQTDTLLSEKNQFYVISTIEEFFPEMSAEELDNSAKLEIAERVYDFGKVMEGEVVDVEFQLTNNGREKLNFRKVKSNCSCVTYELRSQNLKKGKSQMLKLKFDTAGRRGNQYKTVTIFSNDPISPTQMVTIKGTIQQREDSK
ncbi:MAG: DUF1573 domain-containing protein [Cyclobacteriaceae bacterium]